MLVIPVSTEVVVVVVELIECDQRRLTTISLGIDDGGMSGEQIHIFNLSGLSCLVAGNPPFIPLIESIDPALVFDCSRVV